MDETGQQKAVVSSARNNVSSCLFVTLAQGLALNLSITVTGSCHISVKSRAMAQ